MRKDDEGASFDLFEGVDEVINDALGVKSYSHRSAHLDLIREPPTDFDGAAFVASVISRLSQNWEIAIAALDRTPSQANWRWYEPQNRPLF